MTSCAVTTRVLEPDASPVASLPMLAAVPHPLFRKVSCLMPPSSLA
eukprot:CAMPEP_0184392060 /NCGR_PEP_ID=MMETSP0007-20130409/22938_1 /TAXON_ID=97485 /ORGANISM="Prymnesium parvum, Strain Texoma1" /LENGTH=45 /DNA_ID= /DNA_START= /DNA_END= /DNA_ORIENTATION=